MGVLQHFSASLKTSKILVGLAVLFCLGATAQSDASDLLVEEEVIVTATGTKQRALDTAGSVGLLSDLALSRISPSHAAQSLNAVAGVNIHQGSGREHLTAIRSPVLTGGAGAGSFLYLEDGVPSRAASFGNVNGLFELGSEFAQAIEVSKGPGSVLYGSNAQHGLVNILSQAADGTKRVRARTSFDGERAILGSWSNRQTRLSLNLAEDDGFRSDSGYGQRKAQIRHDDMLGSWNLTSLTNLQHLEQETAGFLQEGPRAYRDDDLIEINAFPEAYRDAWSVRTHSKLTKRVDTKNISLTPYVRSSAIEFLRHFVPGQAREEQRHASVGLLSNVKTDKWNAGFDSEFTKGSLYEFQDNPTRFSFVQGLHYDYEVAALVLSPYTQRAFVLADYTTVTVGLRADYTRFDYVNNADVGSSGRFIRVANRRDEFFTLTPKIDVVHRLNTGTSLYARLARGARAPQTADMYSLQQNQVVGEIDPETLDMFELGIKWRGSVWRADAALFAMDKQNFFFRNANGDNVTDGKTKHYGIEVAASGAFNQWFSINIDASYAEHLYNFDDDLESASSSIGSGDQVDSAPNTLARLELVFEPIEKIALSADLRHVGRYATDPGNTASYPGHDVINFLASYRFTKDRMIYAKLENIFDTRYADRADFSFGNDRFFPGRPRRLVLGLDLQL